MFNYVTGNVVYENDEKADSNLVSYITRSFANIWSDYKDRGQKYAKSKELEEKLAKLPVEEAMEEVSKNDETNGASNNTTESISNSSNSTNRNNTSSNSTTNTTTDNDYITVYNADTGEYEV